MAEGEEQTLKYVDSQEHSVNLRSALDQCSVREPDLELISSEGRRVFAHRSVLGIFSPLLVDVFSHTPCCQVSTLLFPDTSSEILSHLLNVLYTGSTEATSDSMGLLTGDSGVFATAALLGITIMPEQKVIEILDRRENSFVDQEDEQNIGLDTGDLVIDTGEGEEEVEEAKVEPEKMEICPSIPMFDLNSLANMAHAQWQEDQESRQSHQDELQSRANPVENEDFYICKLASCQAMIMFENCGARSKILNHYTSHFQRELEQMFGHLLTTELQCTLCHKELKGYIKSKVWIHIGVTHDKTNEILASQGIAPINVNIRSSKVTKRKASEAFLEEVSPRFEEPPVSVPVPPHRGAQGDFQLGGSPPITWGGGGGRNNTCKICGQVTQNRKRLLKHYCTRHFIDRLGAMEFSFIVRNKCAECGRDFIGAKKSSKVIHIGVEHKQIFPILEAEFGHKEEGIWSPLKNVPDPLLESSQGNLEGIHDQSIGVDVDTNVPLDLVVKTPLSSPQNAIAHVPMLSPPLVEKEKSPYLSLITVQHSVPRVQLDMSRSMMAIQAMGNECFVCSKKCDLFRSVLLPHYCGHFYKEIGHGHEEYFTAENCKLCGARATKRKSRIIHLGVKHEVVLPYIQEVLKARGMHGEAVGRNSVKENIDVNKLMIKHEQAEEEEEEVNPPEEMKDNIVETKDELSDIVIKEEKQEEETKPVIETTPKKKINVASSRTQSPALLRPYSPLVSSRSSVPPLLPVENLKSKKIRVASPLLGEGAKNRKSIGSSPVVKGKQAEKEQKPPQELDRIIPVEDGLTTDNLGLVCKLCQVTEVTTHDLLTHYCSHFTSDLKNIATKSINEDHKCLECGKMLGNNKRRLLHFGVLHLHVLPLLNNQLKLLRPPEAVLEETAEDDDFEVTLDSVAESPKKDSPVKKESPVNKVRKPSGNPRTCELCGVKRNTNANLLRHYSKEHFAETIRSRYASLMVGSKCCLCGQNIDCSGKNVGEVEKWIHLGVRHGKTNILLEELGKSQIFVKDKTGNLEINGIQSPPLIQGHELLAVDSVSPIPQPESSEIYACDLCDKKTKSQALLNLHLIGIHFKKEILSKFGNLGNSCKICGKMLPNSDAFAFHMGQEHDLLGHLLQKRCENLSESTSAVDVSIESVSVEDVSIEEVEELGENSEFVCFKCGERRKDKSDLYGHYSVQHFSQELMGEFGVETLCTVGDCGQKCDSATSWIEHMGEVHSRVEKYLPEEHHLPSLSVAPLHCPLNCSIFFHSELQLWDHFRGHHGFSQEVVQKMKMKNYSLKTKET